MSAIVGGGILVLAGAAFRATGPGAIVAFALNGVLAILTALSFAEMSTKFPESGGAYTFAKRVLSVRAAFGVGWVLWFAYIVAGVLYALGFASYGIELIRVLFFRDHVPEWFQGRTPVVLVALIPTLLYSASLIQKASGGGQWATWGKLVVFSLLLLAGFWSVGTQDFGETKEKLTPFFPEGIGGLLNAMGLTFIALQGFDLIAAIAGEVKDPVRNIPRAMLLSLGAALLVYIPLLFIVSTVGTAPGVSISEASASYPETVMARASERFLGPVGYWMVMAAAILSTLSALQANLLAASRVAHSMASDRTLPSILGVQHPKLGTPHMAIYASALTLTALLLAVPDLAAAGAAASLIFLIAFALAHYTSILARKRDEEEENPLSTASGLVLEEPNPPSFQTPYFPLIPVVGGIACAAMAVFQAVAVPAAGGIALVWLGLGGLLYAALFSDRAEIFDAFSEAQNPDLARMRGRNPLVLVPVANPKSAAPMVEIAAALAPPRVGRVLLLRVIPLPSIDGVSQERLESAQVVMSQALTTALRAGHRAEGLVTIAEKPWKEIARVVRSHRCGGVVVGLPEKHEELQGGPAELLLNQLECDFTFLRCPEGWSPRNAERILVPVGRRGHDLEMRARVLGSLQTKNRPQITWVTIVPEGTSAATEAQARRHLHQLAQDNVYGDPILEIVQSDDPASTIARLASEHDLLVLGMHRAENGKRVFGEFNSVLLQKTDTATLLIGGGS
jgi:amino acid transporter